VSAATDAGLASESVRVFLNPISPPGG
jgi:hypothetical protein